MKFIIFAYLLHYKGTVGQSKTSNNDASDNQETKSSAVNGKFSQKAFYNDGLLSRCATGYLEVCDSGNESDCNWRPGNAQDMQRYKRGMIEGAKGMFQGADGLDQGATALDQTNQPGGDAQRQKAKEQREESKQMQWEGENCQIKS
jgi:hypothetical protein